MSRFIDKLNRMAKGIPQTLGFKRAAADSTKPKVQIIVVPSKDATNLVVDGADALLLRISSSSSIKKLLDKVSGENVIWGGWLEGGTQINTEELVKAGCDFLVFSADTPVTAIQNEEIGKILEVEASLSEGMLRAVSGLPVDAVLIDTEAKEGHPFTWQNLITLQRHSDFVGKPLLTPVAQDVTGDELKALWKAGIDGIIVETDRESGRIKELRQLIDSLDFPWPRRRQKTEAILPRTAGLTAPPAHDEEEEEE
ncbi:MAG: hypothetical protein V1767_09460 [Chloroflexota bacterium]